MGDPPGPPSQSAISSSLLSRIWHSPATSGAAMTLFVVLSALWLVAAVTAQVWYHSAPPGYVFSSRSGFYVWVGVGIAGTVLALGSVVHRLWSVRQRPVSVILTICIAVAAELLLLLLVTRHAIATAPYGVDSGEGAAAIATLGLAQVVLVAMLMPLAGRSTRLVSLRGRSPHGRLQWFGLLGLVGMVITCGAFAAWSLHDGTTLIVSTSLIAGQPRMTNVGAWWPGLFAAMATLVVISLVGASATENRLPSRSPGERHPRRAGLAREPGQHVLGDEARNQAPLVGQEQIMLQTSQVLDAEPSCPLQMPQPYGRHPLADRPVLGIATDQQRVRALAHELAEPSARPPPGMCDKARFPDEIREALSQVRGVRPFPEVPHGVVSWKHDPPARVEPETEATLLRHEGDDGVDGHDTAGADHDGALERLVAG